MPVKFEVYQSDQAIPSAASRINENMGFLIIPIINGFGSSRALEAFCVFPNDIEGGVIIHAYTLDRDRVPRAKIENKIFQAELLNKLRTNESELTTSVTTYNLPSGEGWQYQSQNEGIQMVFWHESGE